MRISCNYIVVEEDSCVELYDFNVFVFYIQKGASACISPLYACFLIWKLKHATAFLTQNYGTWQYTILKLECEIRSERLHYTYLHPSKLCAGMPYLIYYIPFLIKFALPISKSQTNGTKSEVSSWDNTNHWVHGW